MDGFVTAHLASDGVAGQYTMAYFERNDIPFHWALADAFTICDGYHCSMLGPTWPNRLYLMTGMVDPAGANGGPVYSNYVPPEGYSWKTYPEMLTEAGVSWRFSAINTANCDIIQTYNVGDTQVPGDAGDYNYSSTDETVALHGSTLHFANTGNSTVAVIDTATVDPENYNPDEKLINVGLFPQDLAVSPDGSQVWVAETGPQTSPSSPSGLSIISAATDTVTAHLPLSGAPSQITFSPPGSEPTWPRPREYGSTTPRPLTWWARSATWVIPAASPSPPTARPST